jgi:hypothetical protein
VTPRSKTTAHNMSDDNQIVARKETLDVSRIFLTYAAYAGDVLETARAADCTIADVLFLAKVEDWDTKLSELKIPTNGSDNKGNPQEELKKRNRMACYIQALRLRGLIDRTLKQIYENQENLEKFCIERDKRGEPFFSMRPLKDLMDSAERVHALMYRALGDVITKEEKDGEGKDQFPALKELHLTVIQQMNKMGAEELEEMKIKPAEKEAGTNAPEKATGYLDVRDALGD